MHIRIKWSLLLQAWRSVNETRHNETMKVDINLMQSFIYKLKSFLLAIKGPYQEVQTALRQLDEVNIVSIMILKSYLSSIWTCLLIWLFKQSKRDTKSIWLSEPRSAQDVWFTFSPAILRLPNKFNGKALFNKRKLREIWTSTVKFHRLTV